MGTCSTNTTTESPCFSLDVFFDLSTTGNNGRILYQTLPIFRALGRKYGRRRKHGSGGGSSPKWQSC